jgi:hydrogenase expression/formation protein HypD
MVYSAIDAIDIARKNPDNKVVFLGVGFETTAPTIAAAIISARDTALNNFYVFSAHKLIPPALAALLESEKIAVDGFMLPGHVSVIIGSNAYLPIVDNYHIPCAIAGFEPADMLQAIFMLVEQVESGTAALKNAYPRAVSAEGNEKAQMVIEEVFQTVDVRWRGLGTIPRSGLKIRKEFSALDAERVFNVELPDAEDPKGCACGEILTGTKSPPECPLYRKVCTPSDPVGPCMVSSEGTCAAYFRYHDD